MDWIHVVQMQYRAAVKTVIKRRVPHKAEVPGPADKLSAAPEGLWSVEWKRYYINVLNMSRNISCETWVESGASETQQHFCLEKRLDKWTTYLYIYLLATLSVAQIT